MRSVHLRYYKIHSGWPNHNTIDGGAGELPLILAAL